MVAGAKSAAVAVQGFPYQSDAGGGVHCAGTRFSLTAIRSWQRGWARSLAKRILAKRIGEKDRRGGGDG